MKVKRFLSSALAIAAIIPLFAFLSRSAPDEAPVYETKQLYTEESETVLFPESKTAIEEYGDKSFTPDSDSYNVTFSKFRNKRGMFLLKNPDGALPVTLSKNYDEPLDLSAFNELFFQMFVGKNDGEQVKFTVVLYSNNTSFRAETQLEGSKIYDVYFPLSDFEERGNITGISLIFEGAASPERFNISSIFADDGYTYSYKNRFSADEFYSPNKLRLTETKLYLTPEDSEAAISAVLDREFANTGTVTVRAVVSNAAAGNMTLSVNSDSVSEYTDISTYTLFPGTNSYAFIFGAAKGTHSYSLTFSGVSTENGDEIVIESVSFSSLADTVSEIPEPYQGAVSSCDLVSDKSKVRISGTLQSSAVINNINASLGVYAADMWGENVTGILASTDVSTVFEITADISSLTVNPYFCAFYVALCDEDSITPIANPVYPSIPSSGRSSQSTVLGVQSTDSSVSFRSNTGQTIVDVDLDRLHSDDNSGGRTHTYGGKYYYLNESCVQELDSAVNFHLDSGVSVMLRILTNDTSEDPKGAYLAVNTANRDEAMRYAAMLDFLSARYKKTAGVIVGSRIDCLLYNRGYSDNILNYCRNYADLLRITSAAVRANTNSAVIIAPFGDGYIYSEYKNIEGDFSYDEITGVGGLCADPIVMSGIVSHMISASGAFQWYVMYECENDPVNAVNLAYRMFTQLTQCSGASPSGNMIMWQPENIPSPEIITENAREMGELFATLGTRSAILSLTRAESDENLICDEIGKADFGENSDRKIYSDKAVETAHTRADTLALWDFRRSFSTGGFTAGGAVTSLTTETSPAMSDFEKTANCRALHGVTSSRFGGGAVVLSYFDSPKNITAADAVNVTLCINSEDGAEYPVKIIFGKGTSRLEYSANVKSGTPVTLRCPMNKGLLVSPTEYTAVAITTDDDISFDISKICAVSTLTPDELEAAMKPETKGEKNAIYDNKYLAAAIVFTTATLIVFSILSIKNHPAQRRKNEK